MKRFPPQIHSAIWSIVILPALMCSMTTQKPCKLTAMETEIVAGIRDRRTLLLADGRELRLAAIEVTDKSRNALQSLVEERDVRLKQLGPEQDRYEQTVALVYVDDSQQSVQQVMLEQDQARVSARICDKACADVLLSAERTARMSHRGQRADPNFAPLQSENIARIAAARGQPDCGCAGSICAGRRQGLVGAGKRRHNIFQSRMALDLRLYRHHSQASPARIRRRGHRSETGWRVIQFGYAVGSNSTAVP